MAQTYTPLQPNQAPAFGTSGQAVTDLQHNYNVQNAGLPGWTPLAEDGQYGPLTQAGVAWKPNNLVVTGGSAAGQFNTNSNTLDTMLGSLNQLYGPKGKTPTLENTNDAYTQMLDRMSATSDLATKALIGTIQAQRSQQTNQINAQYDNYKRGLQMLGIQSNSAQSTPDLLLGHVQQAENEHQAKIQALDVEINKALMDAPIAKDNKDLSVLKEKMDYVKQLKQEQQDYLKNIASQMSAGSSIAESIIAGDYDMFQTLSSTEQSAYIKTLASSFGIPEQLIQGAISKEKFSRMKASKGETGSDDSSPVGLLQQAIDSGMSAEEAALDVAGYYESIGVQVDNKLLNSWMKAAKGLTKTEIPEVETVTPEVVKKNKAIPPWDKNYEAPLDFSKIIDGIGSIFN